MDVYPINFKVFFPHDILGPLPSDLHLLRLLENMEMSVKTSWLGRTVQIIMYKVVIVLRANFEVRDRQTISPNHEVLSGRFDLGSLTLEVSR